jgi:hypothetical protein
MRDRIERSAKGVALVVVATVLGCGGTGAEPATPAPKPAPAAEPAEAAPVEVAAEPGPPAWMIVDGPRPRPPEVVGLVVIGEPRSFHEGLRLLALSVAPLLAPPSLESTFEELAEFAPAGVDLDQPVRLVLLDPEHFDAPEVVVVHYTDLEALGQAAMTKSDRRVVAGIDAGVAVVGDPEAVAHVYGYAVTTLLAEPVPSQLRATLFVHQLVRLHRGAIDGFFAEVQAEAAAEDGPDVAAGLWMIDLMRRWLGDIDAIELDLVATPKDLSVALAVRPRPGGAMAAFVSAQPPATFASVPRLDATAAMFAGRLEASSPEMRAFYEQMMRSMVAPDAVQELMRDYDEWATIGYSEMVGGLALGPRALRASVLLDVTDGARGAELVRRSMTSQPPGLEDDSLEVVARRPVRHRGAVIHQLELRPIAPGAPDVRGLEEIFGAPTVGVSVTGLRDAVLVTLGTGHTARARAQLDAQRRAKRQAAVAPALAAALDQARAQRDSILFTVDLEALTAGHQGRAPAGHPPLALGVSFADGTLTMHLSLPAAQLTALTSM